MARDYWHVFAVIACIFVTCRHSGTQPRLSCSLSLPFFGRVTRWLAACGECENIAELGECMRGVPYMEHNRRLCVWARGTAIRIAMSPHVCHSVTLWWMYLDAVTLVFAASIEFNGDSGEEA